MTAEVFLDATETAPSVDVPRPAAASLVVPLPQVGEPAEVHAPAGVAQVVQRQVPWVLALGAGTVTAALLRHGYTVAATTLLLWLAVHLAVRRRGIQGRMGSSLPPVSGLVRHLSVPFAVVGLAVVAGALDVRALGSSLLLAGVATAALVVASPLARTARQPLRVLVVGDRGGVGHVASSWAQCRDVHLVAAVVDDRDDELDLDLETFGLPQGRGLEAVEELAELHGPDTVVVLPGTTLGRDDLRRLCWSLEGTRTSLAVLTGLDSVPLRRLSLAHVAGHSITEIGSSRPGVHVRLGKAVVDRVGGTLLLLLASPLLLTLAIAIRIDSHGAAFFRQVRVGQGGQLFTMYKLRTMVVDAEVHKAELAAVDEGNGVLFKIHHDPRITRVGHFLRRSSLDELPQLINVVRGEMSLVGPRPALPREVEQYDLVARRRLAVKPGMTGLWQVSGRSDLDWDTSVELDVHYTDNVTIGDDLRICLQTVRAVTGGKGAY
ncbi:exopolysaccharide biosynthesis polyprenyl glycosylphosphotransferase [Nocardioides taihuensis]|uniref:Exopolysaccharide biosynthesis polyprenyl glycosylphosphotransferase n=1 Tax=Nocardioides taihuensis TaxID=1835606 RepID=A0ABW0BLL9_9ACTN